MQLRFVSRIVAASAFPSREMFNWRRYTDSLQKDCAAVLSGFRMVLLNGSMLLPYRAACINLWTFTMSRISALSSTSSVLWPCMQFLFVQSGFLPRISFPTVHRSTQQFLRSVYPRYRGTLLTFSTARRISRRSHYKTPHSSMYCGA